MPVIETSSSMNDAEQPQALTPHQWSGRLFAGALLILAFCAYPLAILPPILRFGDFVFGNLSFSISISAFLLLGIVAIPVALCYHWRVPKFLLIGLAIYAIMLCINFPRRLEYLDEYLYLLGYAAIPLGTGILARTRNHLTFNHICKAASALWLLQIILGTVSLFRGMPVVGTAGNINWMAALLLGLSPWTFVTLRRITLRIHPNTRVATILALGVLLIPTLTLLYHCHSRAAWAAVLLVPLALLIVWFPSRLEKSLFIGFILTLTVTMALLGYRFLPGKLLHFVERDIRLPVWGATVGMSIEQPLGVGAGQFGKHFTPHRIGPYHSRLVAADMTVHPHNEILNIGAQLGIPAAIAFLLFMAPLFMGNFKDPLVNCARLSGFFIIFQSCFDMPLVQPPVNFLGMVFVGLCWPVAVKEGSRNKVKQLSIIAVSTVLIIGALGVVALDLYHDIKMRRAELLKRQAQRFANAKQTEASKILYQQAQKAFEEAIVPIDSITAHYEIGSIILNLDSDADKAGEHFSKVTDIDKNFAHINVLLGRAALLKKDYKAANQYFATECKFFPRNTQAWQNMYNFSLGTYQYQLSLYVENLLRDIYAEKARLAFPDDKLNAKREMFLEMVERRKKPQCLSRASELMYKINYTIMDPIFKELTAKERWQTTLLSGGFDEFDYLFWMNRQQKFAELLSLNDENPVPVQDIVSWFTEHYAITETTAFNLPVRLQRSRKGSPLAIYAAFSEYIDVNGDRCVIELDKEGSPQYATVFSGPVAYFPHKDGNPYHLQTDTTQVNWYRVNLQKKTCVALDTDNPLRKEFKWTPGKTVAYFAPEDYYLRNHILATILGPKNRYLSSRPPSIRLIELFYITGKRPPPIPILKQHCFKPVLDFYKDLYLQVIKSRATQRSEK